MDSNKKCLHNIPVGLYDIEEFLITVERLPITPKLYKRETIKNVRFNENLKVGEVFDFFINAMCNSCKIYVTDGFYYNYVRHVGSATKKTKCGGRFVNC